MKHKTLPLDLTGVKFDSPDGRTFSGYASVFGGIDSYGDQIAPGAYKNTLENRERAIKMRWNHFGPVIGKWKLIQEDEKGLYVEGELTPNHSVASDVAASLQHGAIDGMSIGYVVRDSEMKGPINVLKEIELIEISVVEEPADNAARVDSIKSTIEDAETIREVESILRDAGRFSKAQAAALVSRIKSLSHGDRVGESDTSDLVALLQRRFDKL